MPILTERVDIMIRGLAPNDFDAIVDLESFSPYKPWTERDFTKCLRRKNIAAFVAVSDNKIIGFAILEVFKDHFQLISMLVHPNYRRRRVGTKMIAYIIDQLIPTKRKRILLELRESNLEAQLFLRSCKFRAIEVLRTHYNDTGEDCYKLEFRPHWPEKLTRNDKLGAFARQLEPVAV